MEGTSNICLEGLYVEISCIGWHRETYGCTTFCLQHCQLYAKYIVFWLVFTGIMCSCNVLFKIIIVRGSETLNKKLTCCIIIKYYRVVHLENNTVRVCFQQQLTSVIRETQITTVSRFALTKRTASRVHAEMDID